MALINELSITSFKGAEFLFQSGQVAGGRKTVVFEYPNQSFRFVEDLGNSPRIYTVTGIIAEPNYTNKKNALLQALESQGEGILSHPFYGTINVTTDLYEVDETPSSLGEAVFSMVFRSSEKAIFPSQTSNNKSLINRSGSSLYDKTSEDFGNTFNVTSGFKQNFFSAEQQLNEVSNKFDEATKPFNTSSNFISGFASALQRFNDNILSNIQRPAELGANISGLFKSSETITDSSSDRLVMATRLFSFGKNDTPIIETTAQREERRTNSDAVNSEMNINALVMAYRTVPLINFEVEDQINETEDILDQQFRYVLTGTEDGSGEIIENSLPFTGSNFPEGTVDDLIDLRTEVRKNLELQRVNSRRITDFDPRRGPIKLIGYRLYGNLKNTTDLIEINNITVPSRVVGPIKVLT